MKIFILITCGSPWWTTAICLNKKFIYKEIINFTSQILIHQLFVLTHANNEIKVPYYWFSLWQSQLICACSAQIDGLVQERRNSIANALELRLSCTNPLRWSGDHFNITLLSCQCRKYHRADETSIYLRRSYLNNEIFLCGIWQHLHDIFHMKAIDIEMLDCNTESTPMACMLRFSCPAVLDRMPPGAPFTNMV